MSDTARGYYAPMRRKFYDATLSTLCKMVFNAEESKMCGVELAELEVTACNAIKDLLEGTAPASGENAIVDTVRRALTDVANGRVVRMNADDVAMREERARAEAKNREALDSVAGAN